MDFSNGCFNARRFQYYAKVILMPMLLASIVIQRAHADCACLCVDGNLKTLCSLIDEAQADPVACDPLQLPDCPLPWPAGSAANSGPSSLPSPHDQALNCRVVQVWQGRTQGFVSANICDVQ